MPSKTKIVYRRPFLKWAGSKFQLLPHITALLPSGRTLFEPFAGSCSLMLNTDYERYFVSDTNADLINLYQRVQSGGGEFIRDARRFFTRRHNTSSCYYRLRRRFNRCTDSDERSVLFLFLARASFNGLWRVNANGEFNVPFGQYDQLYFPREELVYFHEKAQRAQFRCLDFRRALGWARGRSCVYLDPPYTPRSTTANFVSYTPAGFTFDDQQELARHARSLAARGIPVLVSNNDVRWVRQLYRGARIRRVQARRSVSASGASRETVHEVLAYFEAAGAVADCG